MTMTVVIERRTHGVDRYEIMGVQNVEQALVIAKHGYPTHHEDIDWDDFEIVKVYNDE